MQYFKDEHGKPWAYENDVAADQMRAGLVPMSAQEIDALHNPPELDLETLAATTQRFVDAEYTRAMRTLADGYPAHERESWPVQLSEAQSLQADANATTPWIDTCAAARGLARTDLAVRILQKDVVYRQISGHLTGVRQWHEDRIAELLNSGEAARAALQEYDALQGWE